MAAAKPPARKRKPPPRRVKPKDPGEQLGEAFIADFLVVWREHGPAAIKTVAAERPLDFVRAALAILPREGPAKVQVFDELDDAQLAARVRQLQRALADAGLHPDGGDPAGAPPADPAQPL
ncbi:MAG TPA: hypothetical protein VII42_09660 [Caulobacteraceae bacterium]